MLGLFGSSGHSPAIEARLRTIERKLDAIMASLGITLDEAPDDDLRELVRAGRKIEAIKLYRERTNCGLKEAKDYVDGL